MTKYILHGGKSRIDCENNRKFYKEIFNIDKKEINFLVVSFAKSKDDRDFSEQLEKMKQLNPDKIIHFVQAVEKEFVKQLKKADVVYLRGGSIKPLMHELEKIDFKELIKNKIVAGSSAGFCVLAKYFYDNDFDTIGEGLGILPVKAFTHFGLPNQYDYDFDKELKHLQDYKIEENLPTIALRETEFIIQEI